MKNLYAILGILLTVSQAFGQVAVGGFETPLQEKAQAYVVSDHEQAVNYLLLHKKEQSRIYKLNAQMQVEDSISPIALDSKYTQNAGSLIEDGQPVLFWSTKNKNSYASQKYDFKTQQYSTKEFELNLKKEKILCQFTWGNQLHILTVLENSSVVKMYKFTNSTTLKSQLIDLSTYIFFDKDYKKENFDKILKYSFILYGLTYEPYELEQMDHRTVTPLPMASNKKKFYVENNNLYITLDHHVDYTEVIRIDLVNSTSTQIYVKKPAIEAGSRYELNSNSFLYHDQLFQIKTSNKKMFLTVKDLEGKLLSEFTADSKSTLDYLNQKPVLQNNGKNTSYKDSQMASSLLKQLKKDRIAVSSFTHKQGYSLQFGAVAARELNLDPAAFDSFELSDGLHIAALSTSWSANPMLMKFQAFTESPNTFATVLTDRDFQPIPGQVEPTVFQKIHTFINNKEFYSTAETLFQFQEKIYLGYFDRQAGRYRFYAFK
ncbi:hypothetical protein [Flavobacterium sp. JP2137]|uniref:hypothetical protein n=1 Tax=Flavobacterium sp. JP2137 TaxID=3414510 RepID=UPI003D2FA9D7